jgi:predicted transcriptional regulator
MPKRVNPDTSTEAYRSLEPEKIAKMYLKIVEALTVAGPMTYEGIAAHLGEKPERVWKRMSEAHRLGLVHRTGDRKVMNSGRQGFIWAAGGTPEPTKKRERVMKGKTVADYSVSINKIKKQTISEVKQLF